jgi:DNA-binding transcriptional LysR family regulator
MHNMKTWDDIKILLEVYRLGNVSAAAKKLGVSHSTVSRRLRSLEKDVGCSLFIRTQKGYELSSGAEPLMQQAELLESEMRDLLLKLEGHSELLPGDVSITMPHDLYEYFFAKHLAQFRREYPEINLAVQVSKGVRDLRSREADLAVRFTGSPPDTLIGKRICTLDQGIFVNSENSWSGSKPIVGWLDDEELPAWATDRFSDAHIGLRIDDLLSMYHSVACGFGVAKMPLFIHNLIRHPSVECIETLSSTWSVWVLSHADLRGNTRVQTLRRRIIDVLTDNKHIFEVPDSI